MGPAHIPGQIHALQVAAGAGLAIPSLYLPDRAPAPDSPASEPSS